MSAAKETKKLPCQTLTTMQTADLLGYARGRFHEKLRSGKLERQGVVVIGEPEPGGDDESRHKRVFTRRSVMVAGG